MYNSFYNLKEDPFRLNTDAAFLYMTAQHREALSGLVYSACNRAALTVLLGEAGTGKTTLLQLLKTWLEERRFVVAVFTNPMLTREEFFDLLLIQLGVECSSSLKSRQLVALQEALVAFRAENRRAVLIVDEAQRLSPELLEEIRLLLNLETPKEKLLEIIIAGQPELMEVLRRPELRQLKQRVSCFCRLQPLNQEEVREYVQHRLAKAGLREQRIFPDDSLALIYQFSHGIPRLVNSLCDSAMQTGFALQCPRLTTSIIREAAKDLDLLPAELKSVELKSVELRPAELKKDLPSNGDGRAPVSTVPVATATAVASTVTATPVTATPVTATPVTAAPAASAKVPAMAAAAPQNGRDRTDRTDPKIPMEAYSTRQKSLGFLASLIDRWR